MSAPEWWEVQGDEWKFERPDLPKPKFQPGDKVVCVDIPPSEADECYYTKLPEAGKLYVVRRYDPNSDALELVGIIGKINLATGGTWAFKSESFVPLAEYRRRLQQCRAQEIAAKQIEAFWKDVDSRDAAGNLRPKRKKAVRQPKRGSQ